MSHVTRTCEPVRPLDGLVVPVAPVHPLLEHSDGEGVRHATSQDCVAVRSIQVSEPATESVSYTAYMLHDNDFESYSLDAQHSKLQEKYRLVTHSM